MEGAENIKETVPFFLVSDMETSLAFYVNGLQFAIQYQWVPKERIEWCKLVSGGGSLMLQQSKKMEKGFLKDEGTVGLGTSVYFICEDALKIYKQLYANGLNPDEPFVGNSMWVTSIKDPDGYALHFESITNVPEETTYTDWLAGQ